MSINKPPAYRATLLFNWLLCVTSACAMIHSRMLGSNRDLVNHQVPFALLLLDMCNNSFNNGLVVIGTWLNAKSLLLSKLVFIHSDHRKDLPKLRKP